MIAKNKRNSGQCKILIAEAIPTEAGQLKYILETHGYQVVAASNGKEALAMVTSDKPDIIVSDIAMPEMDGYELCKKIKTDEKFRNVQVMLLTTLSDPADVIKGLECGADNFVSNPYDERVLLSRIEYLQLNRGLSESKGGQTGVEIVFGGRKHSIASNRQQILNLLLSAYETAVQKNNELTKLQDELRVLNEQLEEKVEQRAAAFRLEVEERKKAEEALRVAEQNFRNSIETFPLGIHIVTAERELLYANQAILDIYGYSSVEELRATTVKQRYTPETYIQFQQRKEAGGLSKSTPSNYEIGIVRKDGGIRHLSVLGKEVVWNGERQYQFIYLDITERKKMQERLVVTDRLASIGELASGIAHEINNPLTGIIGLSELILDADVPADVREDLRTIHGEAQRAAGIVHGLLSFARRHTEGKQPADINDTISKVLQLRAYEHKVNNINVITRLAPDLPEVNANVFQLHQVFINIIINGEYFMTKAHGRGTLTVTTEHVDDVVRISFADDGLGITQEDKEHIFDPFFTTKEVGEGTGLGLSICHGIVAEHGGRVYAESDVGRGATFIVELPIMKAGSDGDSNGAR